MESRSSAANAKPSPWLTETMAGPLPVLVGVPSATSPPSSLSLFCVCLSVPSLHSLCLLSPQASLFHFASLCLHLSPRILSPSAPSPASSLRLAVYLYAITPFLLQLTPCCVVAVVLRILPHAQTGSERLRVLLQDQRAEEEVAGAVWHGHVSAGGRRGRALMRGGVFPIWFFRFERLLAQVSAD